MTCKYQIVIKGNIICKFDYIQNPFTYRNKEWDECIDDCERCYTYQRAEEVEELSEDCQHKNIKVTTNENSCVILCNDCDHVGLGIDPAYEAEVLKKHSGNGMK